MPSFLGALAGAALPFVGKLVGKAADVFLDRESLEDQMHASREAMQHGISWRVDDAKRAGVHPLYALGANLPSFNPVMVGESGEAFSSIVGGMGQAVRESRDPILSSFPRAALIKEVNEGLRIKKEEWLLDEQILSERQRRELEWSREMNAVPGLARPGYPHIAGGRQPGLTEFQFKGFPLLLPSVREGSGSAEALEALENDILQAFVLEQNLAHYGHEGIKALREFVGSSNWSKYFAKAWDNLMGSGSAYGSQAPIRSGGSFR